MSAGGAAGGGAATPRDRIRVVHILDSLNVGGTELNAVRTAERLDQERYDIRFLCLQAGGPLRARLDAAGIPVTEIGVPSLLSSGALRRVAEIRDLVRRDAVDVVHAHDPYANILAAPAVRLAGRGKLIASHRWWRHVHRARVRVANRLSYRFAHRVLANSEAIGKLLVREEGVPADRVVVIPNFVDPEGFVPLAPARREELRSRLGLQPRHLVVGIVANLYPVKGHETLLRAAAMLSPDWPELRFVLVGEGSQRAILEQLARDAGITDRVLMPGRIPHEPGFAGVFDIAVLTSLEEGFPNFVVEAMAAGLPVVASRVGGVVDAVVPDQTGLLVAAGEHEALAASLATLLRDPERRAAMGVAAARRAASRYRLEVVLAKLDDLYAGLAGRAAVG